MKRYGIETIERDETPGFRGTTRTVKWFETESERNKSFEHYTRKVSPDVRDMMINTYTDTSYYKIEEDI